MGVSNKPGSVEDNHSSVMSVAKHLIATYPNSPAGRSHRVPIWSCSEWGLPCHNCYQLRGALLPHHFTLTRPKTWRFIFLLHLPWAHAPQALPGTLPYGARTFLCQSSDYLANSHAELTVITR